MSRVPDEVVAAVHRRSGGVCEAMIPGACVWAGQQLHHRRMRSQGGADEVVNLLDVCHGCHEWVHRHPADAYGRGLLVRSVNSPADTPVRYRNSRDILITDVPDTLI